MTKHKIQTMADLVRERKRVVHQLHETEKELAVSASYFKHNHKKIIWHYVNPFRAILHWVLLLKRWKQL